jgi:hypothetical protein
MDKRKSKSVHESIEHAFAHDVSDAEGGAEAKGEACLINAGREREREDMPARIRKQLESHLHLSFSSSHRPVLLLP